MHVVILAMRTIAALVCVCAVLTAADDPPKTFQQILAKRNPPQIEGLAQRASPDQTGETATESFWDLLKLRDEPVPAAVPELAKILTAHENSTRIHRFAAAQALFTAGGDEARRVLEKRLLAPDYPADMAVTYSSHWEFPEPARSRFIETYLLRNLDEDLKVSVEARWSPDSDKGSTNQDPADAAAKKAARNLRVTVEFANQSPRVLALFVDQQYQTMALHFRGPSGMFAPRAQLVVYGPSPARPMRLRPGEFTSFDVSLELKTDAATLANTQKFMRNAEKIKAFLKSPDTGFALSEFGRYQLSAMIVQTPLSDEQKLSLRKREGIDTDAVWTGRAVSKPVEIGLREPAQ